VTPLATASTAPHLQALAEPGTSPKASGDGSSGSESRGGVDAPV